jgi:ATP-binding cassette, subfamily B, bacterial PglK
MLSKLFTITNKANLSIKLLLFFSILSSLIEFLALSSIITLLILFFQKDYFIIEKLNFLSGISIIYENYFLSISLISFFLFIFFTIFYVLIKYFVRDKTNQFQEQLSCKIFFNFINENILNSKNKDTSNVFNAISSEISRFINLIYAYLEIVSKVFLVVIIGILLFIFNSKISFFISIILITFYFCYFLLFKGFINKFNTGFSLLNRNNVNFIRRGLESLIEFKIFNLIKNFIYEFEKNLKILNKLKLKNEIIQIIPKYLLEIIALGIIVLFLNLFQDQKQNILEVLAVYLACFYKLYPAVNNIFSNYVLYKSNTNSILMINEFLENEKTDVISNGHNENALKEVNSIHLKNISFKYSNTEKNILNDLNLEMKKSDKVVILGKTGSGKTTLLQILMGIIPSTEGIVKINDLSLINKTIPTWLSKITYAPQNPYLFNESIATNIIFKNFDNLNNDEKKRFRQIIDDCLVTEFYSLNDIITKKIGEHGNKLSAGQKQRVNLARALFKKSDVIFLDEPTSNLDENTEKILLKNIFKRYNDKLLIVSTHRKEVLNYSNLTINL